MPKLVDQQAWMSAHVSVFKQQQEVTPTVMTENSSAEYHFAKINLFKARELPFMSASGSKSIKVIHLTPPTDLWPLPSRIDQFHRNSNEQSSVTPFSLIYTSWPISSPVWSKLKTDRGISQTPPLRSTCILLISPWRSTDGDHKRGTAEFGLSHIQNVNGRGKEGNLNPH